jgi:phosphotransferase system enzyme I (PtsI)
MPLILDGVNGLIILNPVTETYEKYQNIKNALQAWDENIQGVAAKPAQTANGTRVEIGANIGDKESAERAVLAGAEGAGLLRTEFLYLNESKPPPEETQIEAYQAVFEQFGDRPVIVRTLDIGGDKPPSFLDFPEELNPFLGWRAIRICFDDIPLFKTQLRAILRAALGYNVLIMYPMISSVEELQRANEILAEVQAELVAENIPFSQDVPVGIMIETPAAVVLADFLAPDCDFFSIGTNDLTQYALAVDRTNDRIADLFQPLHPAVIRLIKQTIAAAHAQGIWVGMCGELAGMPAAIPILLGLGLDEFSMAPSGIPEAKWVISKLTMARAQEIAVRTLTLRTAAAIEEYMGRILATEIQLPQFK